jgi:hypothetical protein
MIIVANTERSALGFQPQKLTVNGNVLVAKVRDNAEVKMTFVDESAASRCHVLLKKNEDDNVPHVHVQCTRIEMTRVRQ